MVFQLCCTFGFVSIKSSSNRPSACDSLFCSWVLCNLHNPPIIIIGSKQHGLCRSVFPRGVPRGIDGKKHFVPVWLGSQDHGQECGWYNVMEVVCAISRLLSSLGVAERRKKQKQSTVQLEHESSMTNCLQSSHCFAHLSPCRSSISPSL